MPLLRIKALGSAEHLYRYHFGDIAVAGKPYQALILDCTQDPMATNAALVANELAAAIARECEEIDPARTFVFEKYAPQDRPPRIWCLSGAQFSGPAASKERAAVVDVPPEIEQQLQRIIDQQPA
jgi:hypothetical protein